MTTPINFHNKWVLVTGASSGLGAEIARQLAWQHGAHLLLLARRETELKALKQSIEEKSQGRCDYLCADLSDEATYPELFERIIKDHDIEAAILNAGLTHFEQDLEQSWEDFQSLLHTNVSAVVYFTRAFIRRFEQQESDGAILVVGSVAGLIAVPFQSAYSGSKAFISHYCLGVHEEITDKAYSISLFAPGGIDTELNSKSGLSHYFSGGLILQSVQSCATEAIDCMRYRKVLFVPRLSNRLQVFASKWVSRTMNKRIVGKAYRKALAAKRRYSKGILETEKKHEP